MSNTVILAIVGLAVVLAEGLIAMVRLLINKYTEKDKQYLTDEEHQILLSLHELHHRYDGDGIPIWYVPRSWDATQKEIVRILADVAQTQNRTLDIIDRLERRLERQE